VFVFGIHVAVSRRLISTTFAEWGAGFERICARREVHVSMHGPRKNSYR
jgi:hypothetical protein